ncbi:hypothetical protein DMUE_2634 [Dictyocoela muelleri]|nr:hypothetical protein DMUE_2634 [Dictyocoela muelleri]
MKSINQIIAREYKQQLLKLENFLKTKNSHILLFFNDKYISELITSNLINVEIITKLPKIFKNKKFLVNFDQNKNQSLFYVLLEQSEILVDCQVILVTTKADFLSRMEKRVRSRFNRNVIVFPFVSFSTYSKLFHICNSIKNFKEVRDKKKTINNKKINDLKDNDLKKNDKEKNNDLKNNKIYLKDKENFHNCKVKLSSEAEDHGNIILKNYLSDPSKNILRENNANPDFIKSKYLMNPTIYPLIKIKIRNELNISDYTLNDTLSILQPMHFAVLILIKKKKIVLKNLISDYKAFVSKASELRKFEFTDLYKAYIDIKEFELQDIDLTILKQFIYKNCPIYIRNLLNKL